MSFKNLNQLTDVSTQTSVVNEVINITGSFFTGSAAFVKNYINIVSGSEVSGGFFKTVYDSNPTSISSSALVDLTYGHSISASQYGYSQTFLNTEKNRVYKEMAKYLLGSTNSLFSFNGINHNNVFFMNFKRRVFKDELRKGQMTITLQVSGSSGENETLVLTDNGATTSYTVGSAGDEASLYSGSTEVGKVYYNAGIAAFHTGSFYSTTLLHWSGSLRNVNETLISGNIDNIVDGFRDRIKQVNIQNQTSLHSTIYYCRAFNNEFNYSSNPTFVDADGRIMPTSGSDNQTRTYATTVGLYNNNNVLLGVAKISEPIKKSPDSEVIFRVRLSW